MTADRDGPLVVKWEGKYVRSLTRGRWEFVSRTGSVNAVVIVAATEGKGVLIAQYRVPVGKRSLELPAGLVGDEDPDATVEGTAVKELEVESGYTTEHIDVLGEFQSSPGLLRESFTLVRASGLRKIGEGGGTEHEDINVHLVAREDIPDFVAARRAEGMAIDVKLLMFMSF